MAQCEIVSELTTTDVAEMDRQRTAVKALAKSVLGGSSTIDLQTLQRLIDAGATSPDDATGLNALGVCFGDILCEMAPADWRILEDEWGRQPTVRWRDAPINLNAIDVIARRIEEGEHADVSFLADELVRRGHELAERQAK